MRYIIIPYEHDPFYSKWYDYENLYAEGMTVIDTVEYKFTSNGKDWNEMQVDHL